MMLAFGGDVLAGRLDPRAVDDGWYLHSRRASIDSTLRAALTDEGFPDLLESLRPPQQEYRELVEILGDYRELLRDGGWAAVPRGKALKRGDRGPRVAALRARLRATGELDAPEDAEPVFDDEVAEAVARVQARHGIAPDSSVGAATLSALNVSVETPHQPDRAQPRPVSLAARRIRGSVRPGQHPGLPASGLQRRTRGFRAAGDRGRRVPERHAGVRRLDDLSGFRPSGTSRSRILVNEMMPKLRDDVYDLASRGFEVVDTEGDSLVQDPASIDWDDEDTTELRYRVRQGSGETNSFGLVKFMFPNRFNIYLHDTPARKLFDRPVRTLSHGCVRVEDPVQLAGYVLDGRGLGRGEDPGGDGGPKAARGRTVALKGPVPVYLVYLTAFVRDGELHFRNDPYGKDGRGRARKNQAPVEEPRSVRSSAELPGAESDEGTARGSGAQLSAALLGGVACAGGDAPHGTHGTTH